MKIHVEADPAAMGRRAADLAAETILEAIASSGRARVILATGASQFQMLAELVDREIDWTSVTGFHLDEYIGLSDQHPASFRRYLRERFVEKVPIDPFHFLQGDAEDLIAECHRVGNLLTEAPIDLAMVGIGENAHLAFNDPPADFETQQPYLVVELDEACRRQQLGEGWFDTLDDVPQQAISMSVHRIMQSRRIIVTVPDERKADAVAASLQGPVTAEVPASILQTHANVTFCLDAAAASKMA